MQTQPQPQPMKLLTITPDDFHAHLDGCSRCRNNPFNLCAVGTKLLMECTTSREPL